MTRSSGASAPDLFARPWDERGPRQAQIAATATARALNGRVHFGTGAGLWMSDALVLPAGGYVLALHFAGKGTVSNTVLQIIVQPTAR